MFYRLQVLTVFQVMKDSSLVTSRAAGVDLSGKLMEGGCVVEHPYVYTESLCSVVMYSFLLPSFIHS